MNNFSNYNPNQQIDNMNFTNNNYPNQYNNQTNSIYSNYPNEILQTIFMATLHFNNHNLLIFLLILIFKININFMRVMGLEPILSAWKADRLPINAYPRI